MSQGTGDWTEYLYFDDQGRLVVKDQALRDELNSRILKQGKIAVDMNEGCAIDWFCPGTSPVPPTPPPNGMCLCVVQDFSDTTKSYPADDKNRD